MPTDLPPDYKPAPPPKPGDGKAPSPVPTPQGEDVKGGARPPKQGPGLPGETDGDAVDPPGWKPAM